MKDRSKPEKAQNSRNKTYLLLILLGLLAFNGTERVLVGLVLQDIKVDLGLSDTQLGLLTGIAFALFYASVGIPLARYADHGNRVNLVSWTTGLCGSMIALCGRADSFIHLLLIRIGVAVGEAGIIPASHSLIADNFTRAERPHAVAVFLLGASLSSVFGYMIGGWLNEYYGWRLTFFAIGAPGVLLALIARSTLSEPRSVQQPEKTKIPSLLEVFTIVWKIKTYRQLFYAFVLSSFFTGGVYKWMPSFFIRTHDMQTSEIGVWFGLLFGLGGALGIYIGGVAASRYAKHNEPLQLQIMSLLYILCAFFNFFAYLTSSKYLALSLLGLSTFATASLGGPLLALIQTLLTDHMRATAFALMYFFTGLIGMGLGPLAAGVLSDVLALFAGEQSLRYSLLILSPGFLILSFHLYLASKTVIDDLSNVLDLDDTKEISNTHEAANQYEVPTA